MKAYIVVLLCGVNLALAHFQTPVRRPNILFFLVDDLGWNDVGFHGLTEIPTPNIDVMAYDGIILNNYYTHPACSPSRSALQSGRYASTTGLQHYVILDPQRVGLPLNISTLPQHLRTLGYRRHMVGKWHLGFHSVELTPLFRGFESHYGFWTGDSDFFFHTTVLDLDRSSAKGVPCYEKNDNFTFLGLNFRDGFQTVNRPGEYLTYLYTERAKRIIENHNPYQPLFLFLAHHGVHRGNFKEPVRAPKPLTESFSNLKNNSTRQNFAGALTAIDRSLGDVVEALARKGMLENTIIVFSTDNGAPIPGTESFNGGSNYPLRGGKITGWEGGSRGSAYVWSGLFKNKGFVYDGLMHISDWLPTLYAAAGGRKKIEDEGLDGKDMWDAIRNNRPSPRKDVLLQADPLVNLTAYRSGDYKIIFSRYDSTPDPNAYYGDPGRGPPPPGFPTEGSKTENVLKRVFGSNAKVKGSPIKIDCGNPSRKTDCDPSTRYCLFNIKDDPCEFRNLADTEPDVLARLRREVEQKWVSAPNFPKLDYASNPVFHKGYWSPWPENFDIEKNSC